MNRWSQISRLLVVTGLTGILSTPMSAEEPARFLSTHCVSCHGAETQEAGLRVDQLPEDLSDRQSFNDWVRIHDRVNSHEMPPRDADQPTKVQRDSFVETLRAKLHQESLARQQREGRVSVRRLNRNEYQYTIHDLMGIGVDLKSLLPEDNKVAGFDTVSAGLETSATHLVRYQQAADRALKALYPARVLLTDVHGYETGTSGLEQSGDVPHSEPARLRLTGREYLEGRQEVHRKGIEPYIRLEGDTFVYGAQLYKHGSVHTPAAPRTGRQAGRYRFRASMQALNTDKPIPVTFGLISTDRFGHEKLEHLLDIRDALPNRRRVVEVIASLPANEQVYLSPNSLTLFRNLPKQPDGKPGLPDFNGPSLAVDWIELEGPLVEINGYQDYFGGIPRAPERFYEDSLNGKKVQDWTRMHPNEYLKPHNHLRMLSMDPKEDAERFLKTFMERAFRGIVPKELAGSLAQRVRQLLDAGQPLDDALLTVYKEVLCSPLFLFRIEEPGELNDFELASRLSYFLWSSLPDDELLDLAAKGELRKPEVLRAQTDRLLADWRSERFIRHFTGQWLELDKLHDMKPDRIYVEYNEDLAWSMGEETRLFFEEVLRNNLPVTEFVNSDWSMLNQRLAQHYGISGVEGMDLRRVALPADSHRGGVITHASILKLTTNATYTSPIKRGAWVLDRILGTPPSPPPPSVEAIEPDIRGAVTIREQMALHKTQPVCASCHVKIDPPGFALENFDVVGGWRDRYRVATGNSQPGDRKVYVELANFPGHKVWLAKPVEAFGETADGSRFQDIDDYRKLLLRDKDQIARNLAGKLIVYSTGATLQFADREAVEEIVRKTKADNYGFRTLLHSVVQSRVFRHK